MKPIQYPDAWLRSIGIPFLTILIGQFGASGPLWAGLQTKQYYLDLAIHLLTVGLVWETNRSLIRQLDLRYSWANHRLRRFLVQTGLGLVASLWEVGAIAYLCHQVFRIRPETFSIPDLLAVELPLTVIFVAALHTIYLGMYLVHYHQSIVARLTTERDEALRMVEGVKLDRFYNENGEQVPSPLQKHLIVNYGLASVPVQTDEVAYIYREQETCFLKTFDGKEFTSGSSLESLEALLPSSTFFRLNRQLLAHIRSIRRFRQDTNGKLSVEFYPAFNQEVFVSKTKAPEFKEWLGKKI
ncbi:MAG: LytTR family transcriptional regulator DNA-binding domain-containing protein [Cytophagales bacterium]|nr:LytTR family transcriptional regulator DNA-binding domain-containing protein [Cytophagales bacterium]